MSSDNSKILVEGDENLEENFVLDFLYNDSRRIGSFLAQFEGDGHLQQLTRTKNATRGTKKTAKKQGGVNLGIGSGKIDIDAETALTMVEGYARVFDPYWSNARAFLNHLIENDMLVDGIGGADIGQFVSVKGYLSVLDLAMLKEAWSLPSIQKKIMGEESASKPIYQMSAAEKIEYKKTQKEEKENKELMIDMMKILPHSTSASLITDEDPASLVWGTLREEYLVTPASELTLAHGARMPGHWSVVGIFTAHPEWTVPNLDAGFDASSMGMLGSMVGIVSEQLAPIARFALGRPAAAYAVTPLLIFREVA